MLEIGLEWYIVAFMLGGSDGFASVECRYSTWIWFFLKNTALYFSFVLILILRYLIWLMMIHI
jgi:hypothetical protein